jgi:hypothetical protein
MDQVRLVVRLVSTEPEDNERLDEMARALRDELLEVDGVVAAYPVMEEVPEGTRGAMQDAMLATFALAAWGTLPAVALVKGLSIPFRDFLRRHRDKKVRVERSDNKVVVELSGVSEQGIEELLMKIINHHDD